MLIRACEVTVHPLPFLLLGCKNTFRLFFFFFFLVKVNLNIVIFKDFL